MAKTIRPELSPLLRMATDIGPLLVFFGVYAFSPGELALPKLLNATVAFMVAICAAVAVSWWKTRHVSPMLWVSAVLVMVMGGLSLYFHNADFIKMKPTIVYSIFAIVLGYGLITRKPVLQHVLEKAYPGLSPAGWRMLTVNWTAFFVVMAVANELVWRLTTAESQQWIWPTYKVWGVIPLTFLFALANIPMLMRHGLTLDKPEDAPIPPEG